MTDKSHSAANDPHGHWLSIIKLCAGDRIRDVMESPQSTRRFMSHENPKLREAAIMSGHAIWGLGNQRDYIEECCLIADKDPDEGPRLAAVAIMGFLLMGSRDRQAMRVLANIVRNESLSARLRNDAYRTLKELECGFIDDITTEIIQDSTHLIAGEPIQLTQIDWELVARARA